MEAVMIAMALVTRTCANSTVGFVVGSAANEAYDGSWIAEEQDVIVASMNYRLHVLGFPGVDLPDKNLGLLDQRAALEWLRDK
jgi:cholinesterase